MAGECTRPGPLDKLGKMQPQVESTNGAGAERLDAIPADDLNFDYSENARPLIREGSYIGFCESVELIPLRKFRMSPRLFLHFRIFKTPDLAESSFVAKLYFVCVAPMRWDADANCLVKTKIGRGSRLFEAFMVANGGPPQRRDRVSMRVFKGRLFKVWVRTVRPKSPDGKEKPASFHYSVVDQLLSREA